MHDIKTKTTSWRSFVVLGFSVAMQLAVSAVYAQTTPTPGSVNQSVDRPVVEPAAPEIEQPSDERQSGFVPPAYSAKITVNRYVLTGNTLFDTDTLLAEISEFTNQPITLTQIYEAADVIQLYYRRQGYLLASVYVPAQQINSGTVRLEVIEGRLSSVYIDGELESYDGSFLIDQLDTIELGQIITSESLEEETLLLNDLPGLTARAVILPGEDYGSSEIAIKATEDPSAITLRLNNHGRKSLGEIRGEIGWLTVNPFLQGDQINLSAITSSDSRLTFLRADYELPLNRSGTRLATSISGFNYDVDVDELGLVGTLEGDGLNFSVTVMHPLIIEQRNRLNAGLALRSNESSESGSLAVSTATKSIELLDFSLNWKVTHRHGAISDLSGVFTSNFDDNPNGTSTDAVKGKINIDYRYTLPFAQHWFAIARANLVSSSDPLPDIERFRIGGPGSVRAYTSSEVAGDEGSLFQMDVGRQFVVGDNTGLILKVFADAGKVERSIPAVGELPEQKLEGYGFGAVITNGIHSFEIEAVDPSTDFVSGDGEESRVWASYSAQF